MATDPFKFYRFVERVDGEAFAATKEFLECLIKDRGV